MAGDRQGLSKAGLRLKLRACPKTARERGTQSLAVFGLALHRCRHPTRRAAVMASVNTSARGRAIESNNKLRTFIFFAFAGLSA